MKKIILQRFSETIKISKLFIIIVTFFSSVQLFCGEQIDPTTLFLGTIQFPHDLNNNDLCLYYNGKKLETEWDKNNLSVQFSFLESKTSQLLYLLICDEVKYQTHPQNNTIQYLKITNDNYKCYELQATRIYDDNEVLISYSWNCSKCELEQGIIADNTIILLFDPTLVEGIQIHTWSKNQAMRLLPTIKIINSATAKELARALAIARLTAVDIDNLHAKESNKNKKINARS